MVVGLFLSLLSDFCALGPGVWWAVTIGATDVTSLDPHRALGHTWVVLWVGQVETPQVMLTSSPRVPGRLHLGGPMDTVLTSADLTPAPHLPWSHRLCDKRERDVISELTLCTLRGEGGSEHKCPAPKTQHSDTRACLAHREAGECGGGGRWTEYSLTHTALPFPLQPSTIRSWLVVALGSIYH